MTEAVRHLQFLIRKFAGQDAPESVDKATTEQATRIETFICVLDQTQFEAVQIVDGQTTVSEHTTIDLVSFAERLAQQNEGEKRIFIFADQTDPNFVLYCVFENAETLVLRIPDSAISQVMTVHRP